MRNITNTIAQSVFVLRGEDATGFVGTGFVRTGVVSRGAKLVRTIAVALAIISTSCSGCFGGEDIESNNESEEYNCTIELLNDAATPGDLVGIQTSEFGSDRSWAVLTHGEDQVFALGSFSSEDDPNLRAILVPFHPNGIDGGTFQLRFEDAEHSCRPVELEVLPTEPETGAWRRQAELTPLFVEKAAARLGYTTTEVQAMVSSEGFREGLTPAEYALAESQWVVDHPDNPQSLVKILDADLDPEIERQLDGIFAGLSPDYVSNYDPSDYPYEIEVLERPEEFALTPLTGLRQGAPVRTNISSPGQLKSEMDDGKFWCAQANNAVSNRLVPAMGVFSFSNPAAQAVWLLAQAMGWAYAKLGALMCASLPAAITSFRVTSDSLSIFEDNPEPTRVGGDMIASAVSGPPVNLVVTAAEAALFAVQFADVATKPTKLVSAIDESDALQKHPDAEILEHYVGNLNGVFLGELVPGLNKLDVTVGGFVYEGIGGFNTPEFTEERPQSPNVQSVPCGDGFCFQQRDIGTGSVDFFPDPSIFKQSAPMPKDSIQITVEKIEINLRYPVYLVAEAGPQTQHYSVENAVDPSLDWFADSPAIEFPTDSTSAQSGEVGFVVTDVSALPATGFVQSASANALGLRRTAFYVDTGDVKLIDVPNCLEPGETFQMEAVRSNVGEGYPIEWNVDLGSIDANGVFTAGATGDVTVTAAIDIAGTRREDARGFIVREQCRCESSFSASGGLALDGQTRFGLSSWFLPGTLERFNGAGMTSLQLEFPVQDVVIQIFWNMPYSFGDVNGVWDIGQWMMTRGGRFAGGGDVGGMRIEYDEANDHAIAFDARLFGSYGSNPEVAGTLEVKAESFDPENSFGPLVTGLCANRDRYEEWRSGR